MGYCLQELGLWGGLWGIVYMGLAVDASIKHYLLQVGPWDVYGGEII